MQKVLKKWRQKCSFFVERDKEFWLCTSRRGAAKIVIDFTEELNSFSTAVLRNAKLRNQNPSLNKICHQRSANAPKFEDRSKEETEWQEHWARAAWKLAKKNPEVKGQTQSCILLACGNVVSPSNILIKPEEREFVVDSGASMQMLSRTDLNSAELETVRISRCSTTVITANGEVLTHGEATVYVKELDNS